MSKIEKLELEKKLRNAYTRHIKWPAKITVREEAGKIIIFEIDENALQNNMQGDECAFEGWILALRELVDYKDHKFALEFTPLQFTEKEKKEKKLQYQHYQRFLFRLNLFDLLFGEKKEKNSYSWFKLSSELKIHLGAECLYNKFRDKEELICNVGKIGREKDKNAESNGNPKSSERDLELELTKKGYLSKFVGTNEIYRQFPIGIFEGKISNEKRIFPGGKACVDLVAEGKEADSIWIFELKKQGNKKLGILSELLFYTAIVRDMALGKIGSGTPEDGFCYNPQRLKGKKIINACFLAPDFHPLLLVEIIDTLNEAWKELDKREDNPCRVKFHKEPLNYNHSAHTRG